MKLDLNKPIGGKNAKAEENFENVPVEQLTEEQIIKKGLKSKDKKDVYCYLGIALLFVLIIIPPIFNVVFDYTRPEDTVKEVVYARLNCVRTVSKAKDPNALVVQYMSTKFTVKTEYHDTTVEKGYFELDYEIDSEYPADTSDIDGILQYKGQPGVQVKEKDYTDADEKKRHSVSVDVDFLTNSALYEEEVFKNYASENSTVGAEYKYLSDLGFYCSKDSKTVVEDTAKKERKDVWKEDTKS